jgi:hypothetical protein
VVSADPDRDPASIVVAPEVEAAYPPVEIHVEEAIEAAKTGATGKASKIPSSYRIRSFISRYRPISRARSRPAIFSTTTSTTRISYRTSSYRTSSYRSR